jgi:hypothetical protein
MGKHAKFIRGRAAFADIALGRTDTRPGRCGVAIVDGISIVERAK